VNYTWLHYQYAVEVVMNKLFKTFLFSVFLPFDLCGQNNQLNQNEIYSSYVQTREDHRQELVEVFERHEVTYDQSGRAFQVQTWVRQVHTPMIDNIVMHHHSKEHNAYACSAVEQPKSAVQKQKQARSLSVSKPEFSGQSRQSYQPEIVNQQNHASVYVGPSRVQQSVDSIENILQRQEADRATLERIDEGCQAVYFRNLREMKELKTYTFEGIVKHLLADDRLDNRRTLELYEFYINYRSIALFFWKNRFRKDLLFGLPAKNKRQLETKKAVEKQRLKVEAEKIESIKAGQRLQAQSEIDRKNKDQVELDKQIQQQAKLQEEKAESEKITAQCECEAEFIKNHKDCACCVTLPRDLESLCHEYENIPLFCDESMSVDQQNRMQQREQALEQTKQENYEQYEKEYAFAASIEGYLRSQDLNPNDFQKFCGTALQQVLHGEICEVFEQVAQQVRVMPYPSQLLCNATNFADAAHDVNKSEFVRLTGVLLDVAWSYAVLPNLMYVEYSGAVASGIVHSFAGFVHMSRHPLQTGKALGKALWFAAETFSLMQLHATYPDEVAPLLQQRKELIAQSVKTLAKGFAESSGPKKMEMLTQFGADFYIPGRTLHAFGAACGVIGKQARIGQTLEGAASMLAEDLGVADILDEAAQRARQLELATQEATAKHVLAELMEAEGQAARAAQGVARGLRPFDVVAAEVRALNGIIPVDNAQLLAEIMEWIEIKLKDVSLDINCFSLEMFNNVQCLHNGTLKTIKFKFNHFVNFELAVQDVVVGNQIVIHGGHLSGSCERLARTGLVRIMKECTLKGGCRQFILEDLITGRCFPKTEFPLEWSLEEISTSLIESFDNIIGLEKNANKPGAFVRRVRRCDGFELSFVYEPVDNQILNIITIWPHG